MRRGINVTVDSRRPSEKHVTFPMNIILKTTTTFEVENAGDWPTFPVSRRFGFPGRGARSSKKLERSKVLVMASTLSINQEPALDNKALAFLGLCERKAVDHRNNDFRMRRLTLRSVKMLCPVIGRLREVLGRLTKCIPGLVIADRDRLIGRLGLKARLENTGIGNRDPAFLLTSTIPLRHLVLLVFRRTSAQEILAAA
ncbi:hypothetical protein ARMGADRAFT_1032376 [Armillaria gallica]|uniref:Uncharacterized protein n=1 Tax=Armillaria gallica TaxID=47427 RepID=A0A2H3DML7_ARMGA|nr:hypothetical protein ARMGADRAFT_1032376 [Armillaria gallica]